MSAMELQLHVQRPGFALDAPAPARRGRYDPCLAPRAAARQPCCAQWQDWNEPTQAGSRCTVRCGKTMPRGVAAHPRTRTGLCLPGG